MGNPSRRPIVLSVALTASIWSVLGDLVESLHASVEALPPPWLYTVLGVAAFAESAPAIGLVVPGQSIIFLSGFLSGNHILDADVAIFIVAGTSLVGDVLGYVLGRHYGLAPLRILPRKLRPGPRGQARLKKLYSEHGMKAVMLARMQPIGRAFGPYFAGVTGMHAARFVAAAAFASMVSATVIVATGYLAGLGFERLSQTIGLVTVSVVTVLLLIVLAIGLCIKHQKEALAPKDDESSEKPSQP
jgi:membrane-associated protein